MGAVFLLYQAALLAATLIAISTAVYAWRHRGTRGATSLTTLLVGETIWAGCAFVMSLPPVRGNADAVVVWSKLMISGVPITVLAAFFFVLEYTGRERYLTPRWIALIGAVPAGATLLAWVDPGPLIWTGLGARDPYAVGGLSYSFGPVFEANILYIYGLMTVATVWIVRFALTSGALYRRQVYGLTVAFVVPWTTSVLNQTGVVSYYWTPVGFAVAGLAFGWTIFRGDLLDIAPIARRTVVERIDSSVIVVDTDDRIIDANPATESLFDRPRDSLLGSNAEAVLDWGSLCPDGASSVTTETTVDGNDVRIEVSPFEDDLGRFVGYVVLLHDISEQKRRERKLREQNRQLDRFAGVVSHDLRNPLNVVAGNIELARDTGDLDYLDQTREGIERMESLIDDLLMLARNGDTESEREPVPLDSLATEAWETVETGDAQLISDASIVIEGDPFRVRQLLENLFRNAVEHGSTGGRAQSDDTVEPARSEPDTTVRVGVCREDDAPVGFFVADDGSGIPPEKREQVLEDGFSTSEKGTGLGLSIVQGIVKSHGWDLAVTESNDGGARFDVRGVDTIKEAESRH